MNTEAPHPNENEDEEVRASYAALLDPDSYTEEDFEDIDFDIRPVSATQVACSGYDLTDMLCYDDRVTERTFRRLGLTPLDDDPDPDTGFNEVFIEEIDEEKFYLITFPEGTNLEDFSMADALSVEEFPEKCFNDLAVDDSEMSCDGDCDHCPQEDCIGKYPID